MFIRSLTHSRSHLTRPTLPSSLFAPKLAIHTTPISLTSNTNTNDPLSISGSSSTPPANTLHTTDTYSKDIDDTPAQDTSVHRVDPSSELVQKPHEPPSGAWSRAGVRTEEYRSVQGGGKSQGGGGGEEEGEGGRRPYEPKGGDGTRYGSRMSWADEKGRETSGPEDSPAEGSSKGRT